MTKQEQDKVTQDYVQDIYDNLNPAEMLGVNSVQNLFNLLNLNLSEGINVLNATLKAIARAGEIDQRFQVKNAQS